MTEKENALYYAKRRVEQQDLLSEAVKKAYLNAFKRIAQQTYSSGMPPTFFEFKKSIYLDAQVNILIQSLVADLYKIILTYSERESELARYKNDIDQEDKINYLPYLNREIKGKTLEDRLNEYSGDAKTEFEAFLAAGLLLKRPINALIAEFNDYMTNPYSSPTIKEVTAKKEGFSARGLIVGGIVYGVSGKYNSAVNNFLRVSKGTAADIFGYSDLSYMAKNGAIGYFANRGSSYPCQVCDDNTGFHSINDQTLPVHPHCMCYAVPAYLGDI